MSKTNPKAENAKGDNNPPAAKSKSNFERLEPGLYRYKRSGVFYSVLKKDGKTTWKNLHCTDKPTARRIVAQERENQTTLDSNLSGLEFGELADKYLNTIAGKAAKTIATRKGIIKRLLAHIPPHTKVRDIKSSEMQAWAGALQLEERPYNEYIRVKSSEMQAGAGGLQLKERSYNEYIRVAKEIMKLAVADRAIIKSPTDDLKRKKLNAIDRRTPTQEQFRAIVADIRAQRFNAHARDSADFIEFMGLAGLGQAELRHLRLCDVSEEKVNKEVAEGGVKRLEERIVKRLEVRRQKTGKSFRIPIYPKVEALLQKLIAQASLPEPQTNEEKAAFPLRRLFKIDDAKKALEAACTRLGYPLFEQRSMRRLFITTAVEKGLDFKTIAATQGHNDGGVLVAKTYSHLRAEHFEEMAAKLT